MRVMMTVNKSQQIVAKKLKNTVVVGKSLINFVVQIHSFTNVSSILYSFSFRYNSNYWVSVTLRISFVSGCSHEERTGYFIMICV